MPSLPWALKQAYLQFAAQALPVVTPLLEALRPMAEGDRSLRWGGRTAVFDVTV